MGYYTDYELDVTGPEVALKEFEETAMVGRTETPSGIPYIDFIENTDRINAKWYQCEKEMVELSKMFPELLFSIEAAGEESGDLWRAWARNGKFKRVEPNMVWPEVDFDKELPLPVVSDAEQARRQRVAELEQELQTLKKRRLI